MIGLLSVTALIFFNKLKQSQTKLAIVLIFLINFLAAMVIIAVLNAWDVILELRHGTEVNVLHFHLFAVIVALPVILILSSLSKSKRK